MKVNLNGSLQTIEIAPRPEKESNNRGTKINRRPLIRNDNGDNFKKGGEGVTKGEMKSERRTKFLFLNFGIYEINNFMGISNNKRTDEMESD